MNNSKIEGLLTGIKLGDLIHRKEVEEEKKECKLCLTISIILAVVALICITALIVKKCRRKPIEEFEYDFDDDFDDSFEEDFSFEGDEDDELEDVLKL